MGYYIDINPHEDKFRVVAIIALNVITLVFATLGVISTTTAEYIVIGSFMYLIGRIRGKKEE